MCRYGRGNDALQAKRGRSAPARRMSLRSAHPNALILSDLRAGRHGVPEPKFAAPPKSTPHGPTRTYTGLHGLTWTYMGLHGLTWAYMGLHGPTLAYLGLSGPIWTYLATSPATPFPPPRNVTA
jgi:hypothetical protein